MQKIKQKRKLKFPTRTSAFYTFYSSKSGGKYVYSLYFGIMH